MSYSISARGATKIIVLALLAAKFDQIIEAQPIHEKDKKAALGTAEAMVNQLADDPEQDVQVNLNGYLSWQGTEDNVTILSSSVSASAHLAAREAQAPVETKNYADGTQATGTAPLPEESPAAATTG
jgi:hypothetical protein